MRLKNILCGLFLTVLTVSVFNFAYAQPDFVQPDTDYSLTADVSEADMDVSVLDSIQMEFEGGGGEEGGEEGVEEGEEEEMLSSVEDLYEGEWNNEYVNAYKNVTIPDSFLIDLSGFVMPIEGNKITSHYGQRRRRFHYGTDLKLQIGDTVVAAFDGKVRIKKFQKRGYGNYLVLRHSNQLETLYGHLSHSFVDEGDSVVAGQPIALGGNTGRSTGSHLHFEFRLLGQAINPAEMIDFNNLCVFDDSYLFKKNKVNIKSASSNKYVRNSYDPVDTSLKYHRIRKGDTLSKIAKLYKVSISQICKLNGIEPTSILNVGKVLRLS